MGFYQRHKHGVLTTVIFHALMLLLLYLGKFVTPLPLPPEEGIVVNFGNLPTGVGKKEPSRPSKPKPSITPPAPKPKPKPKPKPIAKPKPSVSKPKAESGEKVMTQTNEQTVAMKEAERKRKEQAKAEAKARAEAKAEADRLEKEEEQRLAKLEAEKQAAEREERLKQEKIEAERLAAEKAEQERLAKIEAERQAAEEAERKRLEKERLEREERERKIKEMQARAKNAFGGSANSNSSSEGVGFPKGNQGDPSGSANSSNQNQGINDGGGVSFSLEGRSALSVPRPGYGANEDGVVVVQVTVDKYGKVTKANAGYKGSTTLNQTLLNAAKKAALMAKFNVDQNAPAYQQGTITYRFVLD